MYKSKLFYYQYLCIGLAILKDCVLFCFRVFVKKILALLNEFGIICC